MPPGCHALPHYEKTLGPDPSFLRGLLRCALCGGLLAVYTAGSGHRYYACLRSHPRRAARQHVPVCPARSVNAEAIEALAWSMVRETLLDPEALRAGLRDALDANRAAAQRKEQVGELRGLIRQKRRDLDALVSDWLAEEGGDIIRQTLRARAAQLEREIGSHETALASLERQRHLGLTEADIQALERSPNRRAEVSTWPGRTCGAKSADC